MNLNILLAVALMAGSLSAGLVGCASGGNLPVTTENGLALIIGEADMQMGIVNQSELTLPRTDRVAAGSILAFSPIEFRNDKERFSVDPLTLPLGRYVVMRHSAEGIAAGMHPGDAKAFDIHYDARYDTLAAARKDFPTIAESKIKSIAVNGKSVVDVEQWHMRLTMLFSKDRHAFRVLLDQVDYTAPLAPPAPAVDAAALTPATDPSVPVIVALSYRHPDLATENIIQQSILFEFNVNAATGRYRGRPQISGWVPLHSNPDTMPYTIGVLVTEIHSRAEAGYKSIVEFIRSVRGLM